METDDWYAKRKRYEAFMLTDLGILYRAYDRALIDYWRNDANESISHAQFKVLQERCHESTNAFVAKLMELAGVLP